MRITVINFNIKCSNSLDNKCHKDFDFIIGNPPYNTTSKNDKSFINELIEDYKYIDGVYIDEKNYKSLQDDYIKFIRFAQNKMKDLNEGIIGFVTNNDFIDNLTCRGMRYSLLKDFDQIYIINLHGNIKEKEVCPNGFKDENVFDIQQGVCIVFLVKNKNKEKGVHYVDRWGTKEEKYRLSVEHVIYFIDWKILDPKPDFYLFIPFELYLVRDQMG